MSDPDHPKKETPYGRAYRHAREQYQQYAAHWRATIQTIRHHCRAQRQKYGGWEQEKKILEVAAVVLILIYTAIQGCQLSVIRDQEKRQLRAYVLVDQSSILVDESNYVHPRIQIKNGGLTPAYKVAGWGCLVVGRFRVGDGVINTETDLPTGEPEDQSSIPKSIIGPGGTKIKTSFTFCDTKPFTYRPLTSEERVRLRSSTAAIYMYGEETYIDAFGDARFLRYRFLSNDRLGNGVGGTVDDSRGNDAN